MVSTLDHPMPTFQVASSNLISAKQQPSVIEVCIPDSHLSFQQRSTLESWRNPINRDQNSFDQSTTSWSMPMHLPPLSYARKYLLMSACLSFAALTEVLANNNLWLVQQLNLSIWDICSAQSGNLRNLKTGTQSQDSENAQRNLEIAQIPRLRRTYTCKHTLAVPTVPSVLRLFITTMYV